MPIVLLDADEIKLPLREFRYIIAHELGHYVLHSTLDNTRTLTSCPSPAHRVLSTQATMQELKKGKKISGQLPFEESFQLAYSRVQEHEADKFAVIEMGIPIDDAIANAKRGVEEQDSQLENSKKETFKSTHPLWADRIKQFELLRPEVELNKVRNTKRQSIDWQALATQYLQKYSAQ